MAGTAVDLLFFPIDTLKTRLQSVQGFVKAGAFRGIYQGVGSVVVGSAPGGEHTIKRFRSFLKKKHSLNSCCILFDVRHAEKTFSASTRIRADNAYDVRFRWRNREDPSPCYSSRSKRSHQVSVPRPPA